MQPLNETIKSLIEPSFVADLDSISTDELRKRRELASTTEQIISYSRRLVQAKIDIEVAAEGSASSSELISHMTSILSGSALHSSTGRLVDVDISEEQAKAADEYMNEILAEQPDSILEALRHAENVMSAIRHDLHLVIDSLGTELVDRYRTGKATVDVLLDEVTNH